MKLIYTFDDKSTLYPSNNRDCYNYDYLYVEPYNIDGNVRVCLYENRVSIDSLGNHISVKLVGFAINIHHLIHDELTETDKEQLELIHKSYDDFIYDLYDIGKLYKYANALYTKKHIGQWSINTCGLNINSNPRGFLNISVDGQDMINIYSHDDIRKYDDSVDESLTQEECETAIMEFADKLVIYNPKSLMVKSAKNI